MVATTTASLGEHRDHSKMQLPFVSSLMNQSTIYRRHEARLAKTYALKDDPRPAIIRVMSGLPGLRIIVPPYEPQSTTSSNMTMKEKQKQQHKQNPSKLISSQPTLYRHHIGDYSEETFFRAADDNDDDNTSNNTIGISNNYQSSYQLSALQAILSTGVCCVVGEYVFGGHYGRQRRQQQLSSRNSPFHNPHNKGSSLYSPFIRGEGNASDALNVYLMKSHSNTNIVSSTSISTTTASTIRKPSSIILLAASNTSILFGSKLLLERTMSSSTASPSGSSSSDTTGYNLVSSTIAGGIVGIINSLMLYRQQKNTLKMMVENPQHPSPSSMLMTDTTMFHNLPKPFNYHLIGRYMVAATLYFGTYDCITSLMKTAPGRQSGTEDQHTNDEKYVHNNNTMSIAFGGGLAGLVYTSVICQSHHGMLRVLPTAIRAIPIHAMIFYGYETMKEGVRITQ